MTTTTFSDRITYNCPDWCTRVDHDAEQVTPDSPPMHFGLELGTAWTQSNGVAMEAVVELGGEAVYVADPAELRRAAADMVKAAEWLEARQ